jgi:phage gp36-like protein
VSYGTVAELALALHTRVTPESSAWLQLCLDAATAEIDADLDRGAPFDVVPHVIHTVCIARAVEWFKANDAAFGVIGYAETGQLKAPTDSFNRHRSALSPYKLAWGLA